MGQGNPPPVAARSQWSAAPRAAASESSDDSFAVTCSVEASALPFLRCVLDARRGRAFRLGVVQL